MLKRRTPNKLWPGRKIEWTPKMMKYLTDNYSKKNNWELAAHLQLGITAVRIKLYSLGLKRLEMEYWTQVQINFLINNYRKIGDVEMAEIFEKKWPKNKKWTFKHIEKKRKYLNLKRTKEQISAIQQRNVDNGRFLLCPVKRWLVSGVAKEGEVRMWRESHKSNRFVPRIKIKGKFVNWNRWAWKAHCGRIPKGKSVVFKDGNPENMNIDNLELITRAEHALRNLSKSSVVLSDNYVVGIMTLKNKSLRETIKQRPDLIELKRTQLQLNRLIKQKTK